MSITHGVMAVSAASENPERALMVYDLLRNDPECYKLLCYGIEGVSYEVNSEGLRTIPEGYNPDTQNINGMTNYWWGRNDDIEIKDATKNWDAIDALYAEYDKVRSTILTDSSFLMQMISALRLITARKFTPTT